MSKTKKKAVEEKALIPQVVSPEEVRVKKVPGVDIPDVTHHRWKPGQSGNPAGRPKGSGKKQIVQRAINTAVQEMGIDVESGKLLRRFGKQIMAEVIRIALSPDQRVRKAGEVVLQPSEAKVKCLSHCVDRLVPALKTVAHTGGNSRNPAEMSDEEIIRLMDKMVSMATNDPEPDGSIER